MFIFTLTPRAPSRPNGSENGPDPFGQRSTGCVTAYFTTSDNSPTETVPAKFERKGVTRIQRAFNIDL